MASSSSDEEELARFVEAADTSLYYNALYRKTQGQSDIVAPAPSLPSLRNIDDKDEDKLNNELRVTPAFQKHVAKHLTRILDSQLQLDGVDDKNQNCNVTNSKPKDSVGGRKIAHAKRVLAPSKLSSDVVQSSTATTSNAGGVRLLGASERFLALCDITPPSIQRRRKRGHKIARISSDSSSESSDEETDSDVAHEKLSRAAVTAEWVLSGEATKGWEQNTRGEVINVNKNGEVCPLTSGIAASSYGTIRNVHVNTNINNNNNDKEGSSSSKEHQSKWYLKNLQSANVDGDKLAATFDSAINLTNDSSTKRRRKKRKRKRKEQQSEDATTETTEVEELNAGRKKRKKKKKEQKKEQAKKEEDEVEQLLKLIDTDYIPKKRKKKRKDKKEKSSGLLKIQRRKKAISKKKMSRKVDHLSTDLARLMMVSGDKVVS